MKLETPLLPSPLSSPSPSFRLDLPRPSRLKHWLFRLISIGLSALCCLLIAELFLRNRARSIKNSDRLDPGMVQHDSTLGWKLTPNWQGKHHHHDFEATYHITELGFRADSEIPKQRTGKLVAVVGDSFTFGLGVNDNETFVHLLNQQSTNHFINCGTPGYSTDQELLLIEKRIIPEIRPDLVILVVFLGNDFFDNQFDVPLQVEAIKPRFQLTTNGLKLQDPAAALPGTLPTQSRRDLASVVRGENYRQTLMGWMEGHSELVRWATESVGSEQDHGPEFEIRFDGYRKLGMSLINEIERQCRQSRVPLLIAVLGGRSFVEQPSSLSFQYQDFFRKSVLSAAQTNGWITVDLAHSLRVAYNSDRIRRYYPHDGHLNRAGHFFLAQELRACL